MASWVLKQPSGTEKMKQVADAIREGADAFLKRQYSTIFMLSGILAVIIFLVVGLLSSEGFALGAKIAGAFIFGAICSGIAGYLGMYVSVRANVKVAQASRKDANLALQIAIRGGSVTGFAVVAMSLLGVSGLYYLYGYGSDPRVTPFLIVGFGFGASFVALFAQLGGGIYTKAADVGADLVGKVEAGIPEDDPRNPAVIADLVGDNVGDCAGRGADLFESTAAENIGAMILGVALFPYFGVNGIMFPLVARAFGIFATIIGLMVVKLRGNEDPINALNRGYYATATFAALFFGLATYMMLGEHWLNFFIAGIVGIMTSVAIVYITLYYTDKKYRPVKEIAEASRTGAGTNIITGFAVGLECTALPAVVLGIALIVSFKLGELTGLPNGGLYGTAIATMGMLSTAAYILAMDTFGPITDNAGGINEMSGDAPAEAEKITARLDAIGNTTKALTKGYAVGSAGLAAFLLFSAYLDEVTRYTGTVFHVVDIAKVEVFVGALMGAMLVYLFSGFAIRAVGKTASYIIQEVRRQFKEIPGLMEGKAKPDYAKCVDITTKGALKNMIVPGILAVAVPVAVGLCVKWAYAGAPGTPGAESVAALLMVGTIAGIMLANLMNNGGGAWDNAKKYIEEGNYGGKKSDAHKAAVVGDTVGDPFKDTAGPSLHVLIKLLSTVTLVFVVLYI
ncbi:MAG: sodium-translocating pyrophosphatase [Thermoplasmata archaeon]